MEAEPFGEGRVVFLQLVSLSDVVDLAVVNACVEHTKGLSDRLDALVVHAGGGVEVLGLFIVAGGVGFGEFLGLGQQLRNLVFDKGHVVIARLIEALFIGLAVLDRLAGHRELGLAHIRAAQAGLARGVVGAGFQLHGQVSGATRRDVFALGDDAQAIVGEDVELGDALAFIGDGKRTGARLNRVCGNRAGVFFRLDVDAVAAAVFHASRERESESQRGKDDRGALHNETFRGMVSVFCLSTSPRPALRTCLTKTGTMMAR